MIPTEKIKDTVNIIEQVNKLANTKGSWFIFFLVLLLFFAGIIFVKDNRQIESLKEEKTEALRHVATSAEREAKIRDECADRIRVYFEMFKELGIQFSGNVNMFQMIETQTKTAIQTQNDLEDEVKKKK